MKQKGCELCSYDFREKKQWFCQSVVANNSNIDITAKVEKTRENIRSDNRHVQFMDWRLSACDVPSAGFLYCKGFRKFRVWH